MQDSTRDQWRDIYSTPAGRALALQADGRDDNSCSMTCPPTAAALADNGSIHRGAVVVLLDQCMGTAASGVTLKPLTTLDLRLDWLHRPQLGQPVRTRTRSIERIGRIAHVVAEADNGDGTPLVALGTGRFLFGQVAGGQTGSTAPPKIDLGDETWSDFDAYLGLVGKQDRFRLPSAKWLIGSTYLPALHGGVTAATLEEAMVRHCASNEKTAGHRLATATTNFLLAGNANEDMLVETSFIRAGKRAALIEATSYQGESTVAVARGVFASE